MEEFLKDKIQHELSRSVEFEKAGRLEDAFRHLERAHVLGQASTFEHTRVHLRMLKLGWKMHSLREIYGQIIRVIGAATKTPLGIYPTGNTGGSNVWFFKPMPIAADLQKILDESKSH
ncbi:MAG: DUF3703 domain-containing protein [Acidobacteria bacterium]|nr:DUF3703 domain-containing protein [Acidobacteriota bacterium]